VFRTLLGTTGQSHVGAVVVVYVADLTPRQSSGHSGETARADDEECPAGVLWNIGEGIARSPLAMLRLPFLP